MIRFLKAATANLVLATSLLAPLGLVARARDAAGNADQTKGPTEKAIAAAKARGLVWVAKNAKVYCKGGDLYGKGEGEFMPEAEAQKAGNREQKPVDGKK